MRKFGSQLQGADVGLFYYAGHGLQVRGTNYLVPVGANPIREADVDFELDDVALVLRQMEASGTRLNLVMLDACRNNPFGGRGLRAIDSGLAQMRAPQGTLISFATQPGNIAQDGDNGHPINGSFYFAGTAKAELGSAPTTGRDTDVKSSSKPEAAAPLKRAEASNLVLAAQEDVSTAPPLGSKNPEVAMVSPVQTAPLVPFEQGSKLDRSVAIYNGKWRGTASGSCPHASRCDVTINNGMIRGVMFGGEGSGRVSADGSVSCRFEVIGVFHGTVTGKMTSSTSGSGTWRNNVGCAGGWTLSR